MPPDSFAGADKPGERFLLMKTAPLLSATILLLSSPVLSSPTGDWPNWRGPHFDGISREKIPEELPESLPVRWRAEVGTGFSTVSVQGERVLTMGNENDIDTVWCLDADTGEVIWRHDYPCALDPLYYEGGPSATPTISGNEVYTLSRKGHAFRLELETGRVAWSRDLVKDHDLELPEWSFASSPFLDGDRVLLNVGRGGIALDRRTGETLWIPNTETSGYATVVPFSMPGTDAGHLLFSAKGLIAFDSSDGTAAWEFPWKSGRDVNAADPVVRGNRIILSSSAATVALDLPEDGGEPVEAWRQRDMKWYFNPGVLIGDHLYSLHGTTHRPTELICTDFRTGEIVWNEEGFGSGGLMAAGDCVILFDKGELTLFPATPEGFRPMLRQKILDGKCWTAPVLANGRIYCRNAEGDLACVDLRATQ